MVDATAPDTTTTTLSEQQALGLDWTPQTHPPDLHLTSGEAANTLSRTNSQQISQQLFSQSLNWALNQPNQRLIPLKGDPGSGAGIVGGVVGGAKGRVRPAKNNSACDWTSEGGLKKSSWKQEELELMDQFAPVLQPEQQQQFYQTFQIPSHNHNQLNRNPSDMATSATAAHNPSHFLSMGSSDPESETKKEDGGRKGTESAAGASAAGKVLLLSQILILFCFLIFVTYDDEVDAMKALKLNKDKKKGEEDVNSLPSFYPMFQDVHVMIFVGFGFLMTFLKKYGYSAVGYTLMISAVAIQWSILCRGVFHHDGNVIPINITSLINGDFAAAAVLISFGAILGVSSPLQLLIMAFIEVFLYAANEYIGVELLKVVDIGGSMFIHTFGAYFGLAVSFMMRRQHDCVSDKEEATPTSDVFAMIGTVFLWMFWPSFNAVMATGDDQHRAVLNTVLSLTGSCLFSFALSAILSPDNKFNMVHVQNATLAGGVAVGATADLMIKPFGALIIGGGAGVLSTVGYVFVTPFLQKSMGLHDTCGVNNLHGMPGVLAGLIATIVALTATEKDYGKSLYLQYPARAPFDGSQELTDLRQDLVKAEPGLNRTATEQAIYQLAALGVTLLIGIVGGAVTGMILRIPALNSVPKEVLFDDSHSWAVPEEESGGPHCTVATITGPSYQESNPNKYKDSKDSQL